MKDIPFVPYDFFGYLAPGFVLLILLGLLPDFNSYIYQKFYNISAETSSQNQIMLKYSGEISNVSQDTTKAVFKSVNSNLYSQLDSTKNPAVIKDLLQALQLSKAMSEIKKETPPKREHFLLKEKMSPAYYLLWIGVAYILGHVIASISIWSFEEWWVGQQLGTVTTNFFIGDPYTKSSFKKRLPEPIRTLILKQSEYDLKAKNQYLHYNSRIKEQNNVWDKIINAPSDIDKEMRIKINELGKAIYHHAYNYAIKNDVTQKLYERFINLYGFSRNVSMSFIVFIFIMLVYIALGYKIEFLLFIYFFIISGIFAIVLSNCFLTFYRLRYREVLLSYYNSRIGNIDQNDAVPLNP